MVVCRHVFRGALQCRTGACSSPFGLARPPAPARAGPGYLPCSSRRGASPEQGRVRWCAIRAVTRSVSDFPFRVGKQDFWIFRNFCHVDHHQHEPGGLVRRRGSKHRRAKTGCAAALPQSLRPRLKGNDGQGNGAATHIACDNQDIVVWSAWGFEGAASVCRSDATQTFISSPAPACCHCRGDQSHTASE